MQDGPGSGSLDSAAIGRCNADTSARLAALLLEDARPRPADPAAFNPLPLFCLFGDRFYQIFHDPVCQARTRATRKGPVRGVIRPKNLLILDDELDSGRGVITRSPGFVRVLPVCIRRVVRCL